MIVLVLFVLLVSLLLHYNRCKHSFWSSRGVVGPSPHLFVGNIGKTLMLRENTATIYNELYKKYTTEPFVGVYLLQRPALLIRDLEIVKTVLTTNFKSFHKNDYYYDDKTDPLFCHTPFISSGKEWKKRRAEVTPLFTIGKLRSMFPKIQTVCDRVVEHVGENEDNVTGSGVEVHELTRNYLMEVIAASAFGLEAEMFSDKNSDFKKMILNNLFKPSLMNYLKLQIIFILPWYKKFFRIRLIAKEVSDWIIELMRTTVKYREENKIVVDDFINYAMRLKQQENYDFYEKDIPILASMFLVDGVETTSITLAFAIYEIAANPEIQKRLRDEINETLIKNNGNLNHDVLISMHYLDRIMYETLRKYPPMLVMFKRSTEDVNLPDKDGQPVQIPAGTSILIPQYSIQRDPQYYPNPEEFDPERFSEEEIHNRHKYAFLSFGEGPRQCLAIRYAMIINKAVIVNIVRNFSLSVSNRTVQPVKLDETALFFEPENGIYVNFKKIY